ncbi:hypothetical protein [Citrobacter sp.]|uniref:hypothetical protein n=1 Tax=Citrobacter sp. TaxID=1896336 RepID=UPI002902855B|nr:hypothetical protein [Citrobacter sp.]MDU2844917.1 hypothetical protein [Citrobacter sp.]
MNPTDDTFGFLSEWLNSEFCPYCERGRELKRKFDTEQSKPKKIKQRTLSPEEACAALGIKR